MERAPRRIIGVLAFAAVNVGGLATATPASATVTEHTFGITSGELVLEDITQSFTISAEDCYIVADIDDSTTPDTATMTDMSCDPIEGAVNFAITGTGSGDGTWDGTTMSLPFTGQASIDGSACTIGPLTSPPNLEGDDTTLSAGPLQVPAIQSGSGCSAADAAALNAAIGLPGEASMTFNGSWSPALP